jgi:8-oxo-dGTP diphosphatase
MTIGRFLAGVGALIWNPSTDRYLLLRRSDDRDFQQGAWECITGRVDQGESFEEALVREVREEVGAEIQIEFLLATTHFFRGPKNPQYELLGVVYGCTIKNPEEITFGAEHSEMRWVSAEEAFAFLPQDYWLRRIIARAEKLKSDLPIHLRQTFREEGFDIG